VTISSLQFLVVKQQIDHKKESNCFTNMEKKN